VVCRTWRMYDSQVPKRLTLANFCIRVVTFLKCLYKNRNTLKYLILLYLLFTNKKIIQLKITCWKKKKTLSALYTITVNAIFFYKDTFSFLFLSLNQPHISIVLCTAEKNYNFLNLSEYINNIVFLYYFKS